MAALAVRAASQVLYFRGPQAAPENKSLWFFERSAAHARNLRAEVDPIAALAETDEEGFDQPPVKRARLQRVEEQFTCRPTLQPAKADVSPQLRSAAKLARCFARYLYGLSPVSRRNATLR